MAHVTMALDTVLEEFRERFELSGDGFTLVERQSSSVLIYEGMFYDPRVSAEDLEFRMRIYIHDRLSPFLRERYGNSHVWMNNRGFGDMLVTMMLYIEPQYAEDIKKWLAQKSCIKQKLEATDYVL